MNLALFVSTQDKIDGFCFLGILDFDFSLDFDFLDFVYWEFKVGPRTIGESRVGPPGKSQGSRRRGPRRVGPESREVDTKFN